MDINLGRGKRGKKQPRPRFSHSDYEKAQKPLNKKQKNDFNSNLDGSDSEPTSSDHSWDESCDLSPGPVDMSIDSSFHQTTSESDEEISSFEETKTPGPHTKTNPKLACLTLDERLNLLQAKRKAATQTQAPQNWRLFDSLKQNFSLPAPCTNFATLKFDKKSTLAEIFLTQFPLEFCFDLICRRHLDNPLKHPIQPTNLQVLQYLAIRTRIQGRQKKPSESNPVSVDGLNYCLISLEGQPPQKILSKSKKIFKY